MNAKRFLCLLGTMGLVMLVLLGLSPAPAGAQQAAGPAGPVIQPTMQLMIAPPRVRTWQEMEAAAAAEAAAPPSPPRTIPFRPTVDEATYKALKAKAAQTKPAQAPLAPGTTGLAPLAPTTLTATKNFPGAQFGRVPLLYPPDTEGAVGLDHFVEITNSHIDIYQKAAPNNRVNGSGNGVALSAFFGYSAQVLFDPRVLFDSVSHRWIVSADAFPESAAVQRFFFAVSQTADPLGAYYIYQTNVSNGSGGIWDFPQMGLDRQAVIFTANFFTSAGGFIDARMFTVAKSLLYNGPSGTITPTQLFTGLAGNLAPPLVLDSNPNSYLVSANTGDNKVTLYTLTNSGANPPTLSTGAPIPVGSYTVPANAPQPGTTDTIDTSDARFVNASPQIGNSLFQVHAIDSGGFARCRFYEFDTVKKQVIQKGDFGRSGTSFDFNASIAANRHKDIFVTWTSTDTGVNAEVRFSGRLHTDPLSVIPSPGSVLYASTSNLTGNPSTSTPSIQRWGDYSAVSLDPADPSGATAWIVNETILGTSIWGSQIGSIKLPVKTAFPYIDLLLLGD